MKITKYDICIGGMLISIGLLALIPVLGIATYRPL